MRRVSGSPGAEGAPLEGRGREMGICWRVVVLVVEEGQFEGGAMRRDCFGLLVLFLEVVLCMLMMAMVTVMVLMGRLYIPLWRFELCPE